MSRRVVLAIVVAIVVALTVTAVVAYVNASVDLKGHDERIESTSSRVEDTTARRHRLPRRYRVRFHRTRQQLRVAPRRGRSCDDRRYTVTATSRVTHQDFFRYYQEGYWCWRGGARWAGRPNWTHDHWVNNAIDNIWEFDQDFDPVRTHGTTGSPPVSWKRSSQRGKFKACLLRYGCLKTYEIAIWQKIWPVSGWYDSGHEV